jgi:8-oxo-dGTP pyrophosphatase MutT (NUDIX family)
VGRHPQTFAEVNYATMLSQIPPWIERALHFARQKPLDRRVPLLIDDAPVGSVLWHLAEPMAQALSDLKLHDEGLSVLPCRTGGADATLLALAHWLQGKGFCGAWRNELLPVLSGDNAVARIERAAVRALGMRTQAVHLMAYVDIGRSTPMVWMQQRAKDKATDPGLWDTMVGGLVSADEPSLKDAVMREAWEEAGLKLPAEGFHLDECIVLREERPLNDVSYMIEDIVVWNIEMSEDFTPENQDGEVQQFAKKHWSQVMIMLEQGEVTLEAALAIASSGIRRSLFYPQARDKVLKLRV